ncbi:transcriptional regulator [Mycolicibacterium neoaurum]|uniref:transcriptional regulator n=1 Tax=Mycolicibacterium neoaurum TaxID=1795 RepID=UPI001F4CDA5C|nr:transcriptional regulator [Mycolicibacterium neoaurum]
MQADGKELSTIAALANSGYLEGQEVSVIQISSVDIGQALRSRIDNAHVNLLKNIDPYSLPPILIQRGSLRLIDGLHRLHAAKLRGESQIAVQYFEGDDGDALILSIALNSRHGLPLTLRDRKAAAKRVLVQHPDWSDRALAALVGLSNKTVSKIRLELGSQLPSTDRRIGRDGIAQPVRRSEGRARAEEILQKNPDASASEIAKKAGVSLTTAKSIRGIARNSAGASQSISPTAKPADGEVGEGNSTAVGRRRTGQYYRRVLQRLGSDPSIRFSQYGRILFRLLEPVGREERHWDELASNIPNHCRELVAEMATFQAANWARFAAVLRTIGDEKVS